MQPLISPVDHESRSNSHQNEEQNVQVETENTPLLHRFPQIQNERSTSTIVIAGLLLVILVAGAIIGIYLLILQDRSENILPPVDMPLQIVTRVQWDKGSQFSLSMSRHKARYISVVPTNTRQCSGLQDCAKLLNDMQLVRKDGLPYNFLVSSDGQLFEADGWQRMVSSDPSTLVLALIGDFVQEPPTIQQTKQTKKFIQVSESLGYLQSNFVILTNITTFPSNLRDS